MSAYKQFLAQDIIVSPFEVNKSFKITLTETGSFYGSAFYGTNVYGGGKNNGVGIERLKGINDNFTINKSTTGFNNDFYQVLVYNSIKELYYSNYLSSSLGSKVNTGSIYPGSDPSGDVLVGDAYTPNYYNYLSTDLSIPRFIPTGSGDRISVISIPLKLYGDKILPGSVKITSGSLVLKDDSEGTLYVSSSGISSNYGNVIYEHGIIIFTNSGSYSERYYTGSNPDYPELLPNVESFVDNTITLEWSSSFEILETQYQCTIRENEFNFSLNPTLISGSDGEVYPYVTSSYFDPYVTTVGLYNDNQELLAVGKLSQPLPTSRTTDTNIFINIDR